MNYTQSMAFYEIAKWIKYDGFTKEELAQILSAVNKECLKAHGVTINEFISERIENDNKSK